MLDTPAARGPTFSRADFLVHPSRMFRSMRGANPRSARRSQPVRLRRAARACHAPRRTARYAPVLHQGRIAESDQLGQGAGAVGGHHARQGAGHDHGGRCREGRPAGRGVPAEGRERAVRARVHPLRRRRHSRRWPTTGGGTGMVGRWKAFDEMEAIGWIAPQKRPRTVSVQVDGCAPRRKVGPPWPHWSACSRQGRSRRTSRSCCSTRVGR